jgi:hypothetical protein
MRRGENLDMPTFSAQSFGDLLLRYRLAAGLAKEEPAAQSGLSVRGLSDLERCPPRPPPRDPSVARRGRNGYLGHPYTPFRRL